MTVLTLTHICLLIIVISLMVIGIAVFIKYITDVATKRAKRKIQRDRNSRHIELAELQLAQMEERIACMETKLQQLRK